MLWLRCRVGHLVAPVRLEGYARGFDWDILKLEAIHTSLTTQCYSFDTCLVCVFTCLRLCLAEPRWMLTPLAIIIASASVASRI